MIKETYTNPKKTAQTIISIVNNIRPEYALFFRQIIEMLINPFFKANSKLELQDLFLKLRKYVRYTLDPDGIEYLKQPKAIIEDLQKYGYLIGDCDDITLFVILCLWSVGYKCYVKIVAVDNEPDFCHIYPVIELNNEFISFDLTVENNLGYESTSITNSLIIGVSK